MRDPRSVRELRRAYYATISLMDAQLGVVLDELEELGLDSNTVVTFIGDHGYQNGEKGEWCKSNLFELATRIPMYVRIPASLGPGWRRGVRSRAIVESVDLYPTLADLAGIGLPPGQRLGGETLRPLLRTTETGRGGSGHAAAPSPVRNKTWALSQWPRRPSCTQRHGCVDGHGDPYSFDPDQAIMGYKLRTDDWAYIAWVGFDWGVGADTQGKASVPTWDAVYARELYSHVGDVGDLASGEKYEYENVADDPGNAAVVAELHAALKVAVDAAAVKPFPAE